MQFDEDVIDALDYGVPPMGGMRLGIGRRVMLLDPGTNIRKTILVSMASPVAGLSLHVSWA